jgi:hypothetical protein
MRYLALFLLLFSPLASLGRDFSRDFVVVFATATTEARFGKVPLDRSLLAKAIENAAHAEAKGVVIKFFLDLPRNPQSDSRLTRAIATVPVILQARIDDAEPNSNPLPSGVLKGKVVILAYDGPSNPTVATPIGNLGAHRAFILLLKAFYESGS